MNAKQSEGLAMLAVAISAFFWGVFWIPLRALNEAGITGMWAIALFYIFPLLLLLPCYFIRRQHLIHNYKSLHIAGILAGTSMVFYAGALIYTDVIRALLLYYLTPLWSTLLARIVFKESITWIRWATIVLAFIGLLVLLRVDSGFSVQFNFGDWMGLISGVIWAIASVSIRYGDANNSVDISLSYFFWGSVIAIILAQFPIEQNNAMPSFDVIKDIFYWLTVVALVLVIPSAFFIMWGATLLSPGLLGILFMTEISAGTITAAIWADEPFGIHEIIGVVLVSTAGLLEPIYSLRRAKVKNLEN